MVTVYSRVKEFNKTSTFVFKPYTTLLIGQFVARDWRQKGGTMEQLEVIQSVEMEPDGEVKHYMVYAYPEAFTANIDIIIQKYVNWCLSPKKLHNITEKPNTTQPRTAPTSYSSDPPKKERKRKPIKPQPHFSGKLLKKK